MQGRTRTPVASWGLLTLLACAPAAHAQSTRYRADPISLPAWFWPRAMNASGVIVGDFGQPSSGTPQGAVWDGRRLTLLPHTRTESTHLVAINDAGQAVGYREDYSHFPSVRAIAWTGAAGPVDLPSYPDADSVTTGINRAGVISGTGVDAEYLRSAVVWHAGDPVPLGYAEFSRGLAINDAGDVAGVRWFGQDVVVWRHDGTLTELDDFGNPFNWTTRFINNAGQVLGEGNTQQVVLWAADGSGQLISPAGYVSTFAAGLDDAGRVVGNGWAPQDGGTEQAWLFDGQQSLPLGAFVDGDWGRIDRVYAMDSLGRILATSAEGGYLVLTPVPGPWTPAGPGLVLVIATRRRRTKPARTTAPRTALQ